MTIPDKNLVIKTLTETLECSFSPLKRKQIMFEGVKGKLKIVVCTPSSKLHARGHGWFDLTTIQVKLLDEADVSVLAIRLEGNKVYYINFAEIRRFMTPENMFENAKEGEHWKFYVWNNYVEVKGNNEKFLAKPKIVS